jgi:hypothetical protein
MGRIPLTCLGVAAMLMAIGGCGSQGAATEDAATDAVEIPAAAVQDGIVHSTPGPHEDEEIPVRAQTADPCRMPVEEAAAGWLDKSHLTFSQAICGSVAWFDGFFGTKKFDQASAATFGRMSLSSFWDERNGMNTRLRFRARFGLPAMRERTSLIIGRGDDRRAVEGKASPVDEIPSNFNQVADDSFLLGLGYARNQGLARGFDFSMGVRRVPPEPFVKTFYRRAWDLTNSTLLSVQPIGYWRYEEGLGATLNVTADHLLAERLMFRWGSSANVSQDLDVEGFEWTSRMSLFQAFNKKRALTYGVMVHGETQAEVPLRNYGVELRYRQKILRKWLFVELITSMTWPREFLTEERESNFGAGIGVEMYFGPVPEHQLR